MSPALVLVALFLGVLPGAPARGQGAPAASEAPEEPDDERLGRLGLVRVVTRPIYAGVPTEERLLPEVVDAVHATTREEVVRLELWLETGDEVRRSDLSELERKLRRTGLFAEVVVRAVPAAEPDVVDIEVDTRDRLSLVLGASGAFVGETGSYTVAAGETNLFGRGDRLLLSYGETSDGESRGSLAYTDRHVFGEWVRARTFVSTTEEGDGGGLRLWRPARSLAEPWEWSADVSRVESAVDYFRGGDTAAEVPLDEFTLGAELLRGNGPREAYWQVGLRARLDQRDYGRARGPLAGAIDVPGETDTTFVGSVLRFDRTARFARERRLDTLGFVQDLRLGSGVELEFGAEHREEAGRDDAVQPGGRLSAFAALAPLRDTYATLELALTHRLDDGDTAGRTSSAALHAYHLAPAGHTLAASVTFDDVLEHQDLPLELTLGEDNGLRGYPSREFAGMRRVRLNLEDRWDLDVAWRTLSLGLVGFADAGWIAAEGEGLDAPAWSAGVGLRIGSPELLGGGVLRIDLAFPLSAVGGQDYDPLLSVAVGQVFTFFGNDRVLSTR